MLNLDYNLVIIWNYTVTIEVNCFWFFLLVGWFMNLCWLLPIWRFELIAHVFLASKGVGYFFASLWTYKNNGMSRIFKAKKKKFLLIIQRWVAGWLSDRHMTWYEIYRRLNLVHSLTSALGFPASNRCCSETAHIASGFAYLTSRSEYFNITQVN